MANSAAISDACLVVVTFPYFLPTMEIDGRMKGEERQQQNAKMMEDEGGVGCYKGKWG